MHRPLDGEHLGRGGSKATSVPFPAEGNSKLNKLRSLRQRASLFKVVYDASEYYTKIDRPL